MTLKEWAEKEVKIACEKENPDWDGKSFDYGCSCYQSALKAFNSLLDDEQSGCSFNLTKGILLRLLNGYPLKAITEEDFTSVENVISDNAEYLNEHGLKSELPCPRYDSLFRKETLEGKVTYTDVNRVIMHDANGDTWYNSSDINKIIDEMYPIKMPYYPGSEKYKVFGETFYMVNGEDKTAENAGSYNTIRIYYIITPDKERIEVNKEFNV